ncbi:MAG: SAM-dependent DNA methyltransferase [Propionivibrio sp.]|uniref:class I SAM-dependent DNA methyltransferase n=1 Tax=Propionivibrio sp. TaxID=2212460 RepID=UPI001A53FBFE|nr:class I SAM-dependent DNA methyltransferase [Propionivibrio sp.]MBL8414776.1 SAM-dependent DNA methyltransferase [Propionivibrio sp.]
MNLDELLSTLESPIVIRPTRRMTQGELESYLDHAANILRGNADHSEFRGYVFALLFYKRISDCFEEEVRTQAATLTAAGMPKEQALLLARDPQNHHFIVPEAAEWKAVARTAKGQLGQALNDAMLAVERANAHRQNNFDGILTGKIDFNKQDELPRDKLVNLINHFGSQGFDRAHVSDDLFGNAYEYLIRNFASKAGKSSGEFYTPAEVGFLMAEILQPRAGMSVCDWASGSGGLLLQCIRHVKKHGGDVRQLQLHGQESNVTTYNISRINMILHGIPVWEHKQGDSLRDPRHLTADNRLKQVDRVIMNPPFSLEDWGYDTGYRNLRVLYEALQPDEQLRDFVRPYAWLTKLYMLYRKKFYPDASKSIEAAEEDAARTRELIREHIDVDALETEFPTYVLDEHFLSKLKDKNPDAKALDIEAMLSAELRIRMDQDENFRSLSEKLQRLIDEKRAGTLAGIVLIEELEKLTEAVRAAADEANRPIAQQLALKVKMRNAAISETLAAEIAAATLVVADKHCFPGWWNSSTADPELSRALLFMVAKQFSSAGLLADDAMGFIGTLLQTLKRRHYKPQPDGSGSDDSGA